MSYRLTSSNNTSEMVLEISKIVSVVIKILMDGYRVKMSNMHNDFINDDNEEFNFDEDLFEDDEMPVEAESDAEDQELPESGIVAETPAKYAQSYTVALATVKDKVDISAFMMMLIANPKQSASCNDIANFSYANTVVLMAAEATNGYEYR